MGSHKKEWHFNLFVNYYYIYCVLMIDDVLKPLSSYLHVENFPSVFPIQS